MKNLSNRPLIQLESLEWGRGVELICGIDEVGRGCIAGPLVAAAVIFRHSDFSDIQQIQSEYLQINDSKLLSEKIRNKLSEFIQTHSVSYSIVEISSGEIDESGIAHATQQAFYNSVEQLKVQPQVVFTDAFQIQQLKNIPQQNIIKGDQKSLSIAAASIIAKVYRDAVMTKTHELYPQYGFNKHKGYGTKQHIEALEKHSYCPIHRKSFEPVKSIYRSNIQILASI